MVAGKEVLHTRLSLGSLFSLQSPLSTPTQAFHLAPSLSQHLQLDLFSPFPMYSQPPKRVVAAH